MVSRHSPQSRRIARLAAVLLALGLVFPLAAKAETGPRDVIQTLCGALLQAMKQGPQLGYQGRVEKLKSVVAQSYDMPATTKATLGVAFTKLSADEAEQLTDAFTRLSISSYADQFDNWDGESFDVGQPRASGEAMMVVPTRIIPKTGQSTEIDYLMHEDGGHWKIIDVLLDGTISQTAVRRSEFVSIFRRAGYSGLIDVINQKIAAMGTK